MSTKPAKARKKLMAISSGGGHWVQLLRLRPAFEDCDVTFVTVKEGYRADTSSGQFKVIPDANRWNKLALMRTALGVFSVLLKVRPDVVISTGAAPGFFGVVIGGWIGAKTIWVDSAANGEELSLSGKKAGRFVDLWLTQWPHLAGEKGPYFLGSVL